MKRPQISILLPVLNGLPHLDACLRAIASSSGNIDFEVIAGDDGSSDGSAALLDTYRRYSWFRVERGPRRGLFANLNRLLDSARAPLVRFLCQDDLLERECLAEEVRFFAEHPDIAMSFCKSISIDLKDRVLRSAAVDDLPEELSPHLAAQHFFYHGCIPGNLSTVCIRAEFLRGKRFDTSFQVSADYELWTRLCQENALGVIQRRLVRVRQHPGQLSARATSQPKFIKENRRIRARLLPSLPRDLQKCALRYERRRHDAIDFHSMCRLVFRGKLSDAASMFQSFGFERLTAGAFFWLVSVNNRLYRPQAEWKSDAPRDRLPRESDELDPSG